MSSDDEFTIRHMWLEHLYYWETSDRFMTFKHASDEPLEVHVPMPGQWRDWAPEWARERREIILQRLRDRGYRVIEGPFLQVLVPAPPQVHLPMRRFDYVLLFFELVFAGFGVLLAAVSLVNGIQNDFWLCMLLVALLHIAIVVGFFERLKRSGRPPPRGPSLRWEPDTNPLDQ